MPATEATVNRVDDPSTGDDFATYQKGSGALTQGVNQDPEVGGTLLSWDSTGASAETNRVPSASPGSLFKCDVMIDTSITDPRWLMVFDKATAAVNTDVPILRARVSGGFASIDLGLYGIECASGIAVAVSTTIGTLTLPGAGEAYFQVGYV